jgi:hypothetical protein
MKLQNIVFLLIVAMKGYEAATNITSQPDNHNLRGALKIPCQTDDDCAEDPCTRNWCPPVKVCINNKCRNPTIYEKCGTKVCNIQKGEGCCNSKCGICGKYRVAPKKFLQCPKAACKAPKNTRSSPQTNAMNLLLGQP